MTSIQETPMSDVDFMALVRAYGHSCSTVVARQGSGFQTEAEKEKHNCVDLLAQIEDRWRASVSSESAMREVIASAEQSAMTLGRWRPVVDAARQLRAAYGTGLGDGYVALRGLLSAVADLELSDSPAPDAFRREFLRLLPESVDVDAAQVRVEASIAAHTKGEVGQHG